MKPKMGLARKKRIGVIDIISPKATSDTPSCLPITGKNGRIGPIAEKIV